MSTRVAAIGSAKKTSPRDWHPADIVAAVRKRGSNLQQLSLLHGYYPTTLGNTLRRPWPKAERIIAEFIGAPPQRIWPSRYRPDGSPRSGRGERGIGRHKPKRTSRRASVNVQARKAA